LKKLLIPLLCLLIITGCQKKEQKSEAAKQTVKAPAAKPQKSHFALHDLNHTITIDVVDKNISIPGSKRVVALLFFTSWCPSCKAQIPELQDIAKKYKNFQIVGILLNQPKNMARFKKDEHIDFFVSTDIAQNHDLANIIYPLVQAPASMPVPLTLIVVDGKYYTHYLGAAPYEIIESDIKRVEGE